MLEKKCAHCRWSVIVDEESGYCARNPPSVLTAVTSGYPVIKMKQWWCGEYRRSWLRWIKRGVFR